MDEKDIHARIAKQCKDCIIEIGVLWGDTTKVLLENTTATVYGIDPIIPDSMNKDLIGDIKRIEDNTKSFSNFIFIKDYSYNVIKTWDKEIDYLFLDGSHIYEDVVKDLNDWEKFVKKDGYIALHDSRMNRGGAPWHPGPSRLADDIIKNNIYTLEDECFSLTLFRKTK